MFDAGLPFDEASLQRAQGSVRLSATCGPTGSRLGRLYQQGAAKARFPKSYNPTLEAVLINTSGGVTGGDRLDFTLHAEAGAHLVATSQAAEKIYRSLGRDGVVDVTLGLDVGAQLDWLPQETILFEGARLRRTLMVDMTPDARLLALEPVVFGRQAMGEDIKNTFLSDQWRVRRGGQLVFADALRIDEREGAVLRRRASLNGARALASLLYVAPDAEARLDEVRGLLAGLGDDVEAGASAWDDLMTVRFLAADGAALRRALVAFLLPFRDAPLPRVWSL
jgi:urease accessory protein